MESYPFLVTVVRNDDGFLPPEFHMVVKKVFGERVDTCTPIGHELMIHIAQGGEEAAREVVDVLRVINSQAEVQIRLYKDIL
jgi:hypothetical protein